MTDEYRWLVSEAAEPWLGLAREQLESSPGATLAILTHLRKELSAERARLVVEQAELRLRAREKFSGAERMYFTRQGLEQATEERIAEYKAQRFGDGQEIADLCCGIGGDLFSLAGRAAAIGVDREAVTAMLAQANAEVHGLTNKQCRVVVQDAVEFSVAGKHWHCDPDRRERGSRATRGELFQPPLEALEALLDRSSSAAIKLAPATNAPDSWQESAELEWIGSRGECRQQVAWFGELARNPGQRAATIVDAAGGARTIIGSSLSAPPQIQKLQRYLYEPHAAVLAAKLKGALCREHGLAPVSVGIGYLTGDQVIRDAAIDGFEVLDELPFDRKQLKAYCRERGIGRLEIKKRGVDVDPARLRKELVADGDREATIIVSPILGHVKAVVARRMGRS